MPTPLIVASIIGVIVVVGAAACVVMAPRLPTGTRIVAALVFVPPALLCPLGFAGAMEPGDNHVIWRVGYAVVLLACLLAIGRLIFTKRAQPSSARSTQD